MKRLKYNGSRQAFDIDISKRAKEIFRCISLRAYVHNEKVI